MLASNSFVIFASGEGSNAEALIKFAQNQNYKAVGLVSDREAPVVEMAQKMGLLVKVIPHKEEEKLLVALNEMSPTWCFLAGYKRILGEKVLNFFFDKEKKFSKILNIHPSLLPAYPGLDGYRRAFVDGVRISGVTVHLVDSGLDTGLPVIQREFYREESDTLEDFVAKGKSIEHQIFPEALQLAMENKITLKNIHGSRWISLEEK